MPCDFPEHHGSGGGGWGGPIAAIFSAMIAAVVLGPLLHWLEIALACIGIGAAIAAGLVARRRWRQHQALACGRYVPWMQPPQQRPRLLQDETQVIGQQGGQNLELHFHTAEAVEAFRRAIEGR